MKTNRNEMVRELEASLFKSAINMLSNTHYLKININHSSIAYIFSVKCAYFIMSYSYKHTIC